MSDNEEKPKRSWVNAVAASIAGCLVIGIVVVAFRMFALQFSIENGALHIRYWNGSITVSGLK